MMTKILARTLAELRGLGAEIATMDFGYAVPAARFEAGASADRIQALRDAAGTSLPVDYEEFLAECAGFTGMHFHNGYALFGPEHVGGLLQGEGPPKYLLSAGRKGRVLPIGGDGGGNLFLLEVAPPFRVLKWHHERYSREEACSPDARCLSLISEGFTAFLVRVAADWRRYLEGGEDKWPYISG
jgi:hypothetical protein